MTSQQLDGEELSLLDEAVIKYHAKGLDFIEILDQYMNFRAPAERYVYSSSDLLILAEVAEDEEHGRFWYVMYAAARNMVNPVEHILRLAPYKLDTVAFGRYRNIILGEPDKLKYYNWNKLERLVRYGRKQTISTTTTPTAATTAAATTSSASSGD
jgi:hypothetical protein